MTDGPTGQHFLRFIEAWADNAEEFLNTWERIEPSSEPQPAHALNTALKYVEETYGRCPAHFMGQMIACLATHWIYGGDQLMDSLTPIERRLVEDLTLLKITDLQQSAEEHEQRAISP